MLRSLYPQVDWTCVRAVGFDMDGTLYDEADFIAQVYWPIAQLLADAGAGEAERVHEWLFRRWVEMGSSYNRIFEEALTGAGVSGSAATEVIAQCVQAFRGFAPVLSLSVRARALLDALREQFPLFLVSDGSAELQKRKFAALGLERWFDAANVGISGVHGPGYVKPATGILRHIALLDGPGARNGVVYFGDRRIDAQFSANAGFQFVHVKCMHSVGVS